MALSYNTAVISAAAAATQTIVTPPAGKSVKVIGFLITADTNATVAQFKSATTVISGDLRMSANGNNYAAPFSGGHFQTVPGEALQLTSTTGATSGYVRYTVD